MQKYVAFLRGINVSGHHKVPMVELKQQLEKLQFENVATILNSGNILFDSSTNDPDKLESNIAENLKSVFGFPIPTIVRGSSSILKMYTSDPFKEVDINKEIRLYVSFLKHDVANNLSVPWISEDGSYRILSVTNKSILSVLDLSISNTPKAMEILEKNFGNDITTRNWNTIERIVKKLQEGA